MLLQEKQMIKNLFSRLKELSRNSNERDKDIENLINEQSNNIPHSVYYLVQTLFVQEAAIIKLKHEVEDLKNRLLSAQYNSKNNNDGFISSFLRRIYKRNRTVNTANNDNNMRVFNEQPTMNTTFSTCKSSFLGTALQTAIGVAGGVAIGNLLTDLFHNSGHHDTINFFDSYNDSENKQYEVEKLDSFNNENTPLEETCTDNYDVCNDVDYICDDDTYF